MATMNKPALGDTNWTTPVNDNWTSIENNLLDATILTTKGDLLVATGASTPTRLGAGTDGQALKADSTQAAGVAWTSSGLTMTSQEIIDALWGKKFFQDEGFLPANKMFEYLGTPPAFAGTAGAASWNREPGAARPTSSGIAWYDLGAAKSKVLMVFGNMVMLGGYIQALLTPGAPTGLNPNGFAIRNRALSGVGPSIWKVASGAWTRLDTDLGYTVNDFPSPGFALHYDDSTDTLTLFLRNGGQWFKAQSATSTTYTTVRYVALQADFANQRWVTPFVCYAE